MNLTESSRRNALIPLVVKPNRYAGVAGTADPARFATASLRAAVVHPDRFETGIADRTTREAWSTLNSIPGVAADLAFAPWDDLDRLLGAGSVPYWGIESGRPLREFDLLVVTPATPLQFLTLTRILHLAGIPLRHEDRKEGDPIVVATGIGIANPAPIGPIVDASFAGEPRAIVPSLLALLASASGATRRARIDSLASHPAAVRDGRLPPAPQIDSLEPWPVESPRLVPICEADRDALLLDIRRGGIGHRFEFHWRAAEAARARPVEDAVAAADRSLKESGFERIEFAGDHPAAHPDLVILAETLMRRFPGVRLGLDDWGVSQPGPALAREVGRGRRITFAWSAWAGSGGLREKLGVRGSDADLEAAVATAMRGGASLLRFRFGLGWPGETEDDRLAIVRLMRSLRAAAPSGEPAPRIRIELHPFVPQPLSDFAAEGMMAPAVWSGLTTALAATLTEGGTQVRILPPERSRIEGVLGRAGAEAADWLIAAAKEGVGVPDPLAAQESANWLSLLSAAGLDAAAGLPPQPPAQSAPNPIRPIVVTPAIPPAAAAGHAAVTEPEGEGYGRRGRRRLSAAVRPAARYRIRFAKEESLRFTSHLDVTRAFERGMRRLALISLGWRGRAAKLSFGPPLPLGWTGEDEYVDLQFADEVSDSMPRALADVLPEGLVILDLQPIRASVESLSHAIDRAHYDVSFPPESLAGTGMGAGPDLATHLAASVRRLLDSPAIHPPRPAGDDSKIVDVRPGLLGAEAAADARGEPVVRFRLSLGTPGSPRPDRIIPSLFPDATIEPRLARIHRRALRIAGSAREFTPLEVVELDFPWWRETGRKSASGSGS